MVSTLVSCQKDYKSDPNNTGTSRNPLQGTFTCALGYAPFSGDEKNFVDSTQEDGSRVFAITARQYSANKDPKTYQEMNFTIHPYEGVNEYRIDGGKVTGYLNLSDSAGIKVYNIVNVDSFSLITVNSDDGNLKGNFNYTLRPAGVFDTLQDVRVTNGEFDIPKN